jgi:hypothetical protein
VLRRRGRLLRWFRDAQETLRGPQRCSHHEACTVAWDLPLRQDLQSHLSEEYCSRTFWLSAPLVQRMQERVGKGQL